MGKVYFRLLILILKGICLKFLGIIIVEGFFENEVNIKESKVKRWKDRFLMIFFDNWILFGLKFFIGFFIYNES